MIIPQLAHHALRVRRGFVRTVTRSRPYRFAGEQANHAEQAAQTQVSLGLMAAAATHSDDEHRIQLWQTEATLRSREGVLLAQQSSRGLTWEERGELESIRKGLSDLNPPPVSLETAGHLRMGLLGPVGASVGALAGVRLWMVLAAGWAVTGGALAVQTALKERIEDQRDAARAEAATAAQERDAWKERSEQYGQAVADARQTAQQTAEALNAERRANAAFAARQRRLEREIRDQLSRSSTSDPPTFSLRNDEPVQE